MYNYIQKINSVLGPLIPAGSSVVLFDFPNYSNVGDSAIWLGEEIYIKSIARASIVGVVKGQRY